MQITGEIVDRNWPQAIGIVVSDPALNTPARHIQMNFVLSAMRFESRVIR
jgi:hypothetical protein